MRQINSSIMIYIPLSLKEELKLIKCTKIRVKHSLVQRRRSEQDHKTSLLSRGTQLRDQHKMAIMVMSKKTSVLILKKVPCLASQFQRLKLFRT
jgi:hypothetical protein